MSVESTEVSQFLSDGKKNETEEMTVGREVEKKADTLCGFWLFRSARLQRLASENVFAIIFGIAGCIVAMSFSYYTGTITTLEKRYKMSTKTSSLISVGYDVSATLSAGFLGYYGSKGHRPHWIGYGLLSMAGCCLLMASPHFIYGPGEDALKLTRNVYLNETQEDQTICQSKEPSCMKDESLWQPVLLLFLSQFLSGIGCSLFFTLGLSYMDDNSTKAKSPAMISWSAFLRMLGPAIGNSLASFCLRMYIDPELVPLITNADTRWMGAWWLGWLVLAVVMLMAAISMYMFPKELPSARTRRLKLCGDSLDEAPAQLSLQDMMKSLKRLITNKVFMYNNIASMLYLFGYTPYWIFTPKYIETQYQQSAAMATMANGTVALAFSAAGVLISGHVISRYKPSARAMAAWNGIVDIFTVFGILCYVFIGCDDSDKATSRSFAADSCSASCHCEYVHYAPICSPQNITYISACHAGCTGKSKDEVGRLIYTGCQCITGVNISNGTQNQYATQGPCQVDCYKQFLTFLAVMCFLKFVGASGRSSNLLLALRCVLPEDKTFALGFGQMIVSIVSFIPATILFGWILDKHCIVWGKTCGSSGNCWLYDTKSLRYTLNLLSASCIFAGSFWNIAVWYYAKDLQIFDTEEREDTEEEFDLKDKSSEIREK